MRRALVLAIAIAVAVGVVFVNCGVELGADGVWQPLDEMQGELTPSFAPPPRAITSPDTDGRLRVATYNIRDGGIDPQLIASAFLANPELARADVILIQEAWGVPAETSLRIERLATALGMGWVYAPARRLDDHDPRTLGNAILSRYPMDNVAVMQLALATRKRQRIAVGADIHVGDATVRVVTTHLDTTLNIADRILQLRPAAIDLPDAALVGGDFNTNPYSWVAGAVPNLPASGVVDTDQAAQLDDYMSRLNFVNPTAKLGPTEVRFGIEFRLDAIFARGVTVEGGGIERSVTGSDHWPVWIDIKIRP
ncbi:MAG: endonuclease/exonuclease/phosphatase family protein [Deltaproteobacteria bacterium]|nr:endonuclease/exonuclease/phosphatase family protein [Deltaproteobacteria bacterium]